MELSQPLVEQIVTRANDGFEDLVRSTKGARYCRRAILLASTPPDPERLAQFSDSGAPSSLDFDGVNFKACGTRRRTLCEPRSRVYQADARSLIRAEVFGGKTVPETVQEHPVVFATLTAPSFGSVHRASKANQDLGPCHPAKDGTCPHGHKLGCWARHDQDDEIVGGPLCEECYDLAGAVIWNAASTWLWRRTTIYLRRALAKIVGMTTAELSQQVRISYVKVIEYQRRGLIHLHVVIRLDDATDYVCKHSTYPHHGRARGTRSSHGSGHRLVRSRSRRGSAHDCVGISDRYACCGRHITWCSRQLHRQVCHQIGDGLKVL